MQNTDMSARLRTLLERQAEEISICNDLGVAISELYAKVRETNFLLEELADQQLTVTEEIEP